VCKIQDLIPSSDRKVMRKQPSKSRRQQYSANNEPLNAMVTRKYSSRQPRYSSGSARRSTASRRRARPIGRPAARRRGPAPIIIIVVVIVLGVVCWVFGRGCSGSRQARESDRLNAYAQESNKIIQQSAAAAQRFNTVANSVKQLSKTDVDGQLSGIETDCKAIGVESGRVKVPLKAADLQPLVQLAYNLRAQGVDEYQKGIMGVLNNTDRTAATQSIATGFKDLVVSDQVMQNYRSTLDSRLKSAKETTQVADAGLFVASMDSASTAAVNAYVVSIAGPAKSQSTSTPAGATSPAQAMKDYLKTKGVDYTGMTFSVVSESASDPSWKVDKATETGKATQYFLLKGANNVWTVIDYGTSLAAAKIKSDGAPADLAAP
jgi:hypothetical protein